MLSPLLCVCQCALSCLVHMLQFLDQCMLVLLTALHVLQRIITCTLQLHDLCVACLSFEALLKSLQVLPSVCSVC